MLDTQQQLQSRSKEFAVRTVRLVDALPNKPSAWVIGKQILRSATSVAANYRATARARSHAEFVAKIGTVVEEADESVFWLEMLCDCELLEPKRLAPLIQEANELRAIFAATYKTARCVAGDATNSSTPQSCNYPIMQSSNLGVSLD